MTKNKGTKTAKDTMDLETRIKIASARLRLAEFKESDHPRNKKGEFTCKNCGAEHGSQEELDEHSKEHMHMKNPNSEEHEPYADNAVETFYSKEQAKAAGGKKPVYDEDTGLYYKDNREWQKAHDDENTINIQTFNSAEEAKKAGASDPVVDEETGLYFSSNTSWQTAHGGANERAFADKTLHIIKPKDNVAKSRGRPKEPKKPKHERLDPRTKGTGLGEKSKKPKIGTPGSNQIGQEHMDMIDDDARENPEFYDRNELGRGFDPQMDLDSKIYQKIHKDMGNNPNLKKNQKQTDKINDMITKYVEGDVARHNKRTPKGGLRSDLWGAKLTDLKLASATVRMMTAFDESKHPRDNDGKFSSSGGGGDDDIDPDDEGGDLSVNSAAEEIVSMLTLNPEMTKQQVLDDLEDEGFDPDMLQKGYEKAEKNWDDILKKINKDVLGDEDEEPELDHNDVGEGDLVDFGPYGKHYVVDKDYMMSNGRTWWITDDPAELKKDRPMGWSISSSQAKKVLERTEDREDEDDDDFDEDAFNKATSGFAQRSWRGKMAKKRTAKLGMLRTGSQVDQFTATNGDRYVSYFLLNDTENLKGWGVTTASLERNIDTFKNMPFVVTKSAFFPDSPYKENTDHPSTEHFKDLGIKLGNCEGCRKQEVNDMIQQASFQEEFRVGNIEEIIRSKNGDYLAFIKIDPKFAKYEMPPLVSPAIFQLNPMEPQNKIQTWVGMHLAGLDEKPAYGNFAVYRGSCNGDKGACLRQLSASMPKQQTAYFPPCAMKKLFNSRIKVAAMNMALMASQMSSDHSAIERLNVYGEKKKKVALNQTSGVEEVEDETAIPLI